MASIATQHRPVDLVSPEIRAATLGPLDGGDPTAGEEAPMQHAIDEALDAKFGRKANAATDPDAAPPHARIIATGVARGSHDSIWPNSVGVNRDVGTMILTEGGTSAGAETMASGFMRAMRSGNIHRQHPTKAPPRLDAVLDRTLPKLVKRVDMKLGISPAETQTSALAAQIVDGSLVFSGFQPIYVYHVNTGWCSWLNEEPQAMSRKYLLDPGPNIIIMSNGHDDIDALPSAGVVQQRVQEAMEDDSFVLSPDGTEEDHSNEKARHIAGLLHKTFTADGSNGTVMVNVLNVAEWEDTRAKWQRLGDYTRVSSLAFWGMTAKDEFRGRKRREIYEAATPMARGAARAADLVVDLGALTVGLWAAKDALGLSGIVEDVSHMLSAGSVHDVGLLAPDHTPHLAPPKAPVPLPVQAVDGGYAGQPETPPVSGQPYLLYPDTHTADPGDIATATPADSVLGLKNAEVDFYGHQMGLSDDDISALHADAALSAAALYAFLHDRGAPDNELVLEDAHHWLNAGDTYSTHDEAEVVRAAVAAKTHVALPSGGGTTPSPTPNPAAVGQPSIEPTPAHTPTPEPAVTAAAEIPSSSEPYQARHASNERNVLILAGIVATAAVFALYRLRVVAGSRRQLVLAAHGSNSAAAFTPDAVDKEDGVAVSDFRPLPTDFLLPAADPKQESLESAIAALSVPMNTMQTKYGASAADDDTDTGDNDTTDDAADAATLPTSDAAAEAASTPKTFIGPPLPPQRNHRSRDHYRVHDLDELPEGILGQSWLAQHPKPKNAGHHIAASTQPSGNQASSRYNDPIDTGGSIVSDEADKPKRPGSHRRPGRMKTLALKIRDNSRARKEKRAALLSYD